MKNLTVHLDDKPIYDIVYEESFDALPSMMKELGYSNRKICVVSESHVASLYLDAILPVSYTHLDVYKRQGENCLSTKKLCEVNI